MSEGGGEGRGGGGEGAGKREIPSVNPVLSTPAMWGEREIERGGGGWGGEVGVGGTQPESLPTFLLLLFIFFFAPISRWQFFTESPN